ncbi:hypothetical protein pb186bvf_004629 [Paramecium bursaria]
MMNFEDLLSSVSNRQESDCYYLDPPEPLQEYNNELHDILVCYLLAIFSTSNQYRRQVDNGYIIIFIISIIWPFR